VSARRAPAGVPLRAHLRAQREGGFALPVALLVLVLLSMVSATGLYVARSDYRAAEATRHAAVALAAADAGASRTIATWAQLVPTLPAPGDSIVLGWQSLPDGSEYRSVVARAPVGAAESPAPRVLLRTTGKLRAPADARRTVVTVVEVTGGAPLCCGSAVKASIAFDVRGPTPDDGLFEVDGRDRVPPGWAAMCTAPLADVPGVVTSDSAQVDVLGTGSIAGTPPKLQDPTVDPLDFTSFGTTTYAALAAIANVRLIGNQNLNNVIGPVTLLGSCVTTSPLNWGSPLTPAGPCGSYFPLIHVSGNLTLRGAGQGQGILLVDGNFTITDTFRFYGVVIALGNLRINGAGTVYGGLLDRGGADGLGRGDVRNGGRILYSGCAVERALATLPPSMRGGTLTAREYSWFEPIG
jgi:hypothetical protein